MAKKLANKILIIGWDAADWDIIEPLMQEGKMPALERLMKRGVYGRIKTLDPPLSPMLWTSIATGVRADKHGICGFVEPYPNGEGLRPVTSTSRKVKALWNMYTQSGLKTNVVAWWPSNPVEQINGCMVSNLYQVANNPIEEDWVMPEGTIHPPEMVEGMKEWRVHPSEITPSMVLPFIPNIKEDIELRKDKRVISVMKVLAHAASVHAASTYLIENSDWNLMAVYHDAIDHFCHLAMKYHPPRRKFIGKNDFENFKHVVEAAYRFHDMMLERTLDMIDEDTTVILLSDHGFFPDHRRPVVLPKEPSGPAAEHSPYGILVMAGPGIKTTGQEITGASVIDITPTVLTLAGLPVGKDMEGKVLHQCFSENVEPDFIESWEDREGFSGMHDKDQVEDPWAAQEALQQLVELGYIEEMDGDKLEMVERSKYESEYYKARNMIDGGRIDDAIPILERIFNEKGTIRFGQRLAFALLTKRKFGKVEELIGRLKELERNEDRTRKEKRKEYDPNDPFVNQDFEDPLYLEYIEGLLLLALNRQKKALTLLEKVQTKNPSSFEIPMNIAKIHLLRKNYTQAQKQYIKALAVDAKSPQAHHGLGICFLRKGDLDHAIEEFLLALKTNFYMPNVHYHLGEALYRAKFFPDAINALEVAVRLSPGMTKARKLLKELYSGPVTDPMKFAEHDNFLKEKIRGELVVVTGLEGSGFELVLDEMAKTGVEILYEEKNITNKERKRIEFLKIKELASSSAFLPGYQPKAMHINIQALSFLPEDLKYRVIVVHRDLKEVIIEQQRFMDKKVTKDTLSIKHLGIIQQLQDKLNAWISSRPDIPVLELSFEEFSQDKKEQIDILKDFIGH